MQGARDEQYGLMGDKHPFEKIVFGTDVGTDLMADVKNDYEAFMDHLDMEQNYRDLIMGGSGAKIFGLEN